jgi:hypothetical protein
MALSLSLATGSSALIESPVASIPTWRGRMNKTLATAQQTVPDWRDFIESSLRVGAYEKNDEWVG